MYCLLFLIFVQVFAATSASQPLFTSVWCHGSHQVFKWPFLSSFF